MEARSSSTSLTFSSLSAENDPFLENSSSSKSSKTTFLGEETSLLSSSFYLLDSSLPFSSENDLTLVKPDEKDDYEVVNVKDYAGRLYPPPISSLKLFKSGKPYTYLSFNEDDESFVLDEIRIPNRDFFRSSRADGRLKLYFDTSADEFYTLDEDENNKKN